MLKKVKPFIFPLFIIFVFQLIALWPSFKLALFGDDWLAFWRSWTMVETDPYHQGYNALTYFVTPYGPQDIIMGILRHFFGLNSTPYYIVSFIFRLIASFAVYIVFYKLTKSKLGAFMAGLFFAISPIGMDTTNWVFNMPSYLGTAALVVFFFYYVKSRENSKFSQLIISYLFLFLAIIIVPIRMAGIIPLVFLTEVFWLLKLPARNTLIKVLVRMALFLAVFIFVKQIGTSFANPQESIDKFNAGFGMLKQQIFVERKPEVILYPLTIFGNMIFPEILWDNAGKMFSVTLLGRTRPFPLFSLVMFSFYLFLCSKFLLVDKKSGAKHFVSAAVLGFLFNVMVWFFYKTSPATFGGFSTFGATLIGGFTFIFYLLLICTRDMAKASWTIPMFSILIWPIAFILMPWSFYPYTIYPSVHRYMIMSASGVAFMVGSLALTKVNRRLLFLGFILFVFFSHFRVSSSFLHNLALRQGQDIAEKVWEPVYAELPKEDIGKYYVVYLASDNHSNGDIVYNNVFFGLNPRMSILTNIINKDNIPFAITTYDDLISMVTDGKSLIAQGHEAQPISFDQIYAFQIIGDTPETIKVTNIRDSVLKDLALKRKEYFSTISAQ